MAGTPFFPHHLMKEAACAFVFIAVLIALVIFIPVEHQEPADPFNTPDHIKPEWYFLASYQLLKLIPLALIGILIQIVFFVFLFLVPFIEKSPHRSIKKRQLPLFIALLVLVMFIILTLWGGLS